jgi:hypothetical protein
MHLVVRQFLIIVGITPSIVTWESLTVKRSKMEGKSKKKKKKKEKKNKKEKNTRNHDEDEKTYRMNSPNALPNGAP